jgi:hypothetical protein
MNCSQARDNLAGLLYDDLPGGIKADLKNHLAGCAGCRQEYQSLEAVRRLLGSSAAPEIRINLPQLYRQAAERQERRLRRWRRTAALVTAAAALFAFFAFGLRLEARIETHQLVLRWGSPPPVADVQGPVLPAVTSPAPELPKEVPSNRSAEEQLQLLSRLIHALVDDLQALERQEREDSYQFQARLQAVQQQSVRRCADLQRSIDGLYLLSHKGE